MLHPLVARSPCVTLIRLRPVRSTKVAPTKSGRSSGSPRYSAGRPGVKVPGVVRQDGRVTFTRGGTEAGIQDLPSSASFHRRAGIGAGMAVEKAGKTYWRKVPCRKEPGRLYPYRRESWRSHARCRWSSPRLRVRERKSSARIESSVTVLPTLPRSLGCIGHGTGLAGDGFCLGFGRHARRTRQQQERQDL